MKFIFHAQVIWWHWESAPFLRHPCFVWVGLRKQVAPYLQLDEGAEVAAAAAGNRRLSMPSSRCLLRPPSVWLADLRWHSPYAPFLTPSVTFTQSLLVASVGFFPACISDVWSDDRLKVSNWIVADIFFLQLINVKVSVRMVGRHVGATYGLVESPPELFTPPPHWSDTLPGNLDTANLSNLDIIKP